MSVSGTEQDITLTEDDFAQLALPLQHCAIHYWDDIDTLQAHQSQWGCEPLPVLPWKESTCAGVTP